MLHTSEECVINPSFEVTLEREVPDPLPAAHFPGGKQTEQTLFSPRRPGHQSPGRYSPNLTPTEKMKCPIIEAVDDIIRVDAMWPNLSSRFITKDVTSSCSDYHRNSEKLNKKVLSGCGTCRENFMPSFKKMKETSPALKFE
jgi:hypothetical protein